MWSPAGVTKIVVTATNSVSAAITAPNFAGFIRPPSEREPRADAGDPRRRDSGDVPEGLPRPEFGTCRRREIQQVEYVEIDAEPPTSAHPEILVCPEVQDVERLQPLGAIRLEPDRRVAVIGNRRTTIRICCAEDVCALSLDSRLALQESRERNVVWHSITAGDVAGPRPRLVEREELVVRVLEDAGEPSMVLDGEVGHLPHPSRRGALGQREFHRVEPIGVIRVYPLVADEGRAPERRCIVIQRHAPAIVGGVQLSVGAGIAPCDRNAIRAVWPLYVDRLDAVVDELVDVHHAESEARRQLALVTQG